MIQVPYHDNPGNACALACYTMVSQYLLPEENITFEYLGNISSWKHGYVIWAFESWSYLLEKKVSIVNYDSIDYELWATNGFDAMKNSLPEKEFEYIKKNSFEPDNLKDSIEKVFTYDNFKYIRRKPSWEDVLNEFSKPGICDLTLNSAILNKQDGFVGHRVVLIDINDNEIVFHDPNINGDGAYRCESTDIFRKAFDDNPELTRYSLKN